MTKKRRNQYEQQSFERNQRRSWARTLKKEYRNVLELMIQMSFELHDPVGPGPGKPDEKKPLQYGPESKAFFEIPCSCRECINGGFDLSDGIRKLVEDHSTKNSGSIECRGRDDRYGNLCRSSLNYEIFAKYRQEGDAK